MVVNSLQKVLIKIENFDLKVLEVKALYCNKDRNDKKGEVLLVSAKRPLRADQRSFALKDPSSNQGRPR